VVSATGALSAPHEMRIGVVNTPAGLALFKRAVSCSLILRAALVTHYDPRIDRDAD
jgi:hypothetical protein